MKTQKDYSWLLVAIVLGLALLGSMGCKSAHPVSHGDSTECAVFEGYPVFHDADFETEAVFVPLEQLSVDNTGSTVWIDDNGFTVIPVRDAETMQFVTEGLQHVVLHSRVMPNKFKLIKYPKL